MDAERIWISVLAGLATVIVQPLLLTQPGYGAGLACTAFFSWHGSRGSGTASNQEIAFGASLLSVCSGWLPVSFFTSSGFTHFPASWISAIQGPVAAGMGPGRIISKRQRVGNFGCMLLLFFCTKRL
jgi:hypothetical protein